MAKTTLSDLGISIEEGWMRAVLLDETGEMVWQDAVELAIGGSDVELEAALVTLLRSRPQDLSVATLAITSTSEPHILLDAEGNGVSSSVAEDLGLRRRYADYLESTARRSRAISGTHAKAEALGPLLLALREEDADVFRSLSLALSPKDALLRRLTGNALTDPGSASDSALFSPVEGEWARLILNPLNLDEARLPKVSPGLEAHRLSPSAQSTFPCLAETRLLTGVPIDHANLAAAGAVEDGTFHLSLFGAAKAISLSADFLPNPLRSVSAARFFRPGLYAQRLDLGPAEAFAAWADVLTDQGANQGADRGTDRGADRGGAVAEGGAPSPYFIPNLGHGAALAGLTPGTPPAVLGLAIRDGFAFEAQVAAEALGDLGPLNTPYLLSAPRGLADAWGPMLASALDAPIELCQDANHHSALGAARLARAGRCGEDTLRRAGSLKSYHPDAELRASFLEKRAGLAGFKSRLTQP